MNHLRIVDPNALSAHQVLHFAWAKNWAVRKGDWKVICKPDAKTNIAVFTLHNLAELMPEVRLRNSSLCMKLGRKK